MQLRAALEAFRQRRKTDSQRGQRSPLAQKAL